MPVKPVTFGLQAPLLPPLKLLDFIMLMEKLGWDRVWLPDHLLFPDNYHAPDAWSMLAAAAARTERIGLGTAVADPHRTPAAVFAQRLATLDQLSKGRMAWGLGAGEAMNLVPFGIPWDKPASRLEEFATVVRGLLDGGPVTFSGTYQHLQDAVLGVRPWEGHRIPLYMAALGPRLQRFAARHADAWIAGSVPIETYREAAATFDTNATEAGRQVDHVVGPLPVAVTEDVRWVDGYLRQIGLMLVWPGIWEKLRIPVPDESLTYVSYNPCDADHRARHDRLRAALPIEAMRQFVVWGSPETIIQRLRQYLDAGISHLLLLDASPQPLHSLEVLATQVLPALRVV